MNITQILKPECVCFPLRATDKTSVITELIDVLNEQGQLADYDDVLRSVLAREQTRSTGIGMGLAVPHGKSRGVDALTMAIGKPETPIDFDSVDGRPCNLIVLLASPVDKTGPHIQALASVSRLWQTESFRTAVAQATTPQELYTAIEQQQS